MKTSTLHCSFRAWAESADQLFAHPYNPITYYSALGRCSFFAGGGGGYMWNFKGNYTFCKIGENMSWVSVYNGPQRGWHYSSLLCWSLSQCTFKWKGATEDWTVTYTQASLVKAWEEDIWEGSKTMPEAPQNMKNIYVVIYWTREQAVTQSLLYLFQGTWFKLVL